MKYLLVLVLVLASAPTYAQPNSEPPAHPDAEMDAAELDVAARILFDTGTRAYDAGRFDEALDRYTNAYELSDRPQLLYNIAVSHDRLEHKVQAAEFYERFVEAVPDSPRVGVARSRSEILRRALAEEAARDSGNEEDRTTQSNQEAAPLERTPSPEPSRSLAGPIASFGIAGAGLITFAVAGLVTGGRFRDAEASCESVTGCVESELNAVDTTALVADIGLGVAIAGTVVGIIWLLAGGGEDDDQSASVSPFAGPQVAGLEFAGSF